MVFKISFLFTMIVINSVAQNINIGQFEDKNFFTNLIWMTRDQALVWCRVRGWDLLSIDSLEEFHYLQDAVSNHTINNGYWTSAMKVDTYKWNNDTVVGPEYPIVVSYRSCVAFWGAVLHSTNCEGIPGLEYYPLCQLKE